MRAVTRLVVLVTIVLPPLHAQSPGIGDGRPFRAVALTFGTSSLSVDPVNAILSNAGFADLPTHAVTLGGGGYYAFGRALLGADVARASTTESRPVNGRSDQATSWQGTVTVGYAVVATNRLSIYPSLGVGLGRLDVRLQSTTGGATTAQPQPTFAELAQNPGGESTVAGSHLLFNIGVSEDYLLTNPTPTGFGITFGIRAGFALAPHRTTWRTAGAPVLAGPDASAGGPFLRIAVGLGSR